MVEHPALAQVIFPGNVHTGLLVKPPVRQVKVVRYFPGFLKHDAVRDEQRVYVAGYPGYVVGEGHRGAPHDEHVRDDAPAGQALTQSSECLFELGPAEKNVARLAHAASRSLADR